MEPLCKHPYVSAFIDLHYSQLKKIRSQMKDCVSHLAMMLLLLELASQLSEKHAKSFLTSRQYYITATGIFIVTLLLLLDGISFIGLHTTWIDRVMKNSLIKDRKNEWDCPTGIRRVVRIYDIVTHVIGYGVVSVVIIVGCVTDGWKGTFQNVQL